MATKAATKITPLADRVVVKPLDEAEEMRGGLYIPDTAKEKPIQGTVVAAGHGKSLDSGQVRELTVKPGDTVLFSRYAGTEVKIEGEEHPIMREDDILGIVE